MANVTTDQLASTTTPQGANLVGYAAAPTGAVGRTVLSKLRDGNALTPEDFGAVGDGTTDDGPALQKWLNALGNGYYGSLGAKTYLTKQFLVCPANVNNVTITGVSRYQTVIRYAGASTNGDILSLGNSSYETRGWRFQSLTINSATRMTGGHAIHLTRVIFTLLDDVVIAGQYGADGLSPATETLWNGIFFDGFLYCRITGSDIKVQATGIKIANLPNSQLYGAGMYINGGGRIGECGQHGIWIGGGAGGVVVDEYDIIDNSLSGANYANVWIDTALSNTGNREIFFGDRVTIDSSGGYGVYVNDTLNGQSPVGGGTLRFTGMWVASSQKSNIYVAAWGAAAIPSIISLVGAKIVNSQANGFECPATNPLVLLDGCEFSYNSGTAVVAGNNARTRASLFARNGAIYNGSVLPDNYNEQTSFFQDRQYYALLNGANPLLNFDANDFIQYNRSQDQMDFVAGGTLGLRLSTNGALFPNNCAFGDARFSTFLSNRNPIINFDANDFIQYDRVNNRMNFYVNGQCHFYIDATGYHTQ